jgi:preprotein translocase subunit YajC
MTLFEIFMNWLPLLVLFAVLIFLMGSKRVGYQKAISDQLDEVRRQNQILERIAIALEKRGP